MRGILRENRWQVETRAWISAATLKEFMPLPDRRITLDDSDLTPYFLMSEFQFSSSVIGAMVPSFAGRLIRNRPSLETAYCGLASAAPLTF